MRLRLDSGLRVSLFDGDGAYELARGIADGTFKMQMGDLDRLIRLRTYRDECQRVTVPLDADAAVDLILRLPSELKRELARKSASRPELGSVPPFPVAAENGIEFGW